MPGTRKLGRATDHRMSMLKGMVTFLLEKGQIETTHTRAKEVSALTDKMITLGKTNTLASRRQAAAFLKKESVLAKLFNEIAPTYKDRNGGYTRVLKIGPRRGDGAEMAIIALVVEEEVATKTKKTRSSATKSKPKATKQAKKAVEKEVATKEEAVEAVEEVVADAVEEVVDSDASDTTDTVE